MRTSSSRAASARGCSSCCWMLQQPNLLVLDEPTNHLDIDSVEALEAALEEFQGTVCVISHDRYFLDRIVDRIVEVGAGGPARTRAAGRTGTSARVRPADVAL